MDKGYHARGDLSNTGSEWYGIAGGYPLLIHPPSRGTLHTVRQSEKTHRSAFFFLCGTGYFRFLLRFLYLLFASENSISCNYGSRNYDRVMLTAKTLLKDQFLFFWPMTALLELFPEAFLRIFTSDPTVIREAARMVRLYAAGFFVIPVQAVFQQINLSAGQERSCLYMAIIRKLILHIPLLLILPVVMANKVFAVVLSAPLSDIISVVMTLSDFIGAGLAL